MGRGGATAATDHLYPKILNEMHQLHSHLGGGQSVVRNATHVLRQAGIGNTADHKGTVVAEVANVLLHLLWPGGAVETEHIDGEGLQDGHDRSDV